VGARRLIQRFRHFAPATVAALLLVGLAVGLGLTHAIDARVRRGFYELRGPRAPHASVIFVAIDEDTARAWGPGPWPWIRYEELLDHILRGGPRVVAVLEPGPRVIAGDGAPPTLAAAVRDGRLVMPPPTPGFGQPSVSLDPDGVVEAIDLGDANELRGATITSTLLERLGQKPSARRLAVNFIGPPDTLPTLPAHHVARGEIPASTFTGRVVVIGVRGERFTAYVPTPVGAMSPGEVHAHGIQGVVERASWRRGPWFVELLIVLACAVGASGGIRRIRSATWTAAIGFGAAFAIVAIAYVLFSRASMLVGVAAPLVSLAAGTLAGLVLERQDTQRDIAAMRRTVSRRATAEAGRRPSESATDDRFAAALFAYFDVVSCGWARLPPGGWHLELARWWSVDAEDVQEQRRDVRRDPWRLPYSTHRPEWSVRPILQEALGTRALVVPVVGFARLHGFWILNVPRDRSFSDAELRLLGHLTGQLALTRELIRVEPHAPPTTMVDTVRVVHDDALRLGQILDHHVSLLDNLPVAIAVASLWGQLEYANAAMRKFLAVTGVVDPYELGVAEILARLTRVSADAIRQVVRDVVSGGAAVRVDTRTAEGDALGQAYELVLSRVQLPGDELEVDELSRTALFLTMSTHVERDLAALDWRWSAASAGSGARHVVDLAEMVRQATAELAAVGAAEGPPVIEVRADSTVVVASGEDLGGAVADILRESMRGAPAGLRLVVEDDRDSVSVTVHIAATLPASDVAAVRTATAADAPAHLGALVRARDRVAANRGSVEITSSLEEGTALALRLPKPGRS